MTEFFPPGDDRVCSVKIETGRPPRIAVTAGNNSYGDWFGQAHLKTDAAYEEEVLWVFATGITPNGSEDKYFKTKLRTGSGVTGTEIRQVTKDARLEEQLSLTVSNGLYKLGTPLVVGRMDGHDLVLLVKNEVEETTVK